MRLATEIQGDETSTANPARNENPSSRNSTQKHEIHPELPESRPIESAEHFAIVARATNDAVRDWNVKTGALSWPQGLEALLGYGSSSRQRDIGFWQKQIHPQDRARTAGSIRDALAAEGDHWTGEYRFRHVDGSYLDLLERALIVRDSEGAAIRFVGSLMDVTARKQLQDQLVRSQKMEAFGQLAGGVAHDFNNFLTTILGYSDLLLDELGMKGAVADHIGEIRSAAGRASVLTGSTARLQPEASPRPARDRSEFASHESRTLAAPSSGRRHFGRNAISIAAKTACTPKWIPASLRKSS